ncbi:hypothetical protein FZW96_21315 [Bacillus sp. BGMRC 2118]|nr:hypothetical protein FZW96_21315 [Bacillus sp. BGMRC 2118]
MKKRIGFGTLAWFVLFCGFWFNWPNSNYGSILESIFNKLNLPLYSDGTHGFYYPFSVQIIFWLIAFSLSKIFPNDYGSKVAGRVGLFLSILFSVLSIIFLFFG